MAPERDVREVGSQIESLLEELHAAGPVVAERAEELVRLLLELYGNALGQVVSLAGGDEPAQQALLSRLLTDPLLASLLVLHDLHPVPLDERIGTALDEVRPYLGSHAGGVEFTGVDDEGVAHVRLQGSCEGCASSTVTVTFAIEKAILAAAPEVIRVEAEGVTPAPTLLQIGAKPVEQRWARVEGLRLLPGQVTVIHVDAGPATVPVLVCSAAGSLYAYRNACAVCDAELTGAALDGQLLTCPACQATYDVVLAGRSPTDDDVHLDPLPLLPDAGEFKVAVGEVVAR